MLDALAQLHKHVVHVRFCRCVAVLRCTIVTGQTIQDVQVLTCPMSADEMAPVGIYVLRIDR